MVWSLRQLDLDLMTVSATHFSLHNADTAARACPGIWSEIAGFLCCQSHVTNDTSTDVSGDNRVRLLLIALSRLLRFLAYVKQGLPDAQATFQTLVCVASVRRTRAVSCLI